ncbi:GntR family transcriptional regulator [Spirillospora sp. NPDC029432]|uniref:GntR family transcriptional regulator n=1 Tax=Spirillospora sp. NPDC029432 TaxID=3154599 RepID=UPI003451A342
MGATSAERIADAVYERLREEIFAGDLAPGARLSVPALAERLEVSRSPVREAVFRLVQDRLASEEPRRGAVVAEIGARELAAIYDVREVLEGLAARLAVENAGRRLVTALREVLGEHERAVRDTDVAAVTEADMRFHELIRRASGNAEVVRLLDGVQTQVRLAMRTTRVMSGPRQAVDDHRAILTAIESGDPDAAERAARAHVFRLRSTLLRQAEDMGDVGAMEDMG